MLDYFFFCKKWRKMFERYGSSDSLKFKTALCDSCVHSNLTIVAIYIYI